MYLRLHGSYSLLNSEIFINDIYETILAHTNPLVLIDVSLFPSDTTITNYDDDVSNLAQMLRIKVRKLVVLETEERREFIAFYETVAINRGLDVKIFCDEAEAFTWLKKI